mmetsp:Transcript_58534/g.163233  ORF Transcript_58534/g.163233 Transcript_58534/m.163233 type:complete len:132 (-) Transcript_58534:111-506(-)
MSSRIILFCGEEACSETCMLSTHVFLIQDVFPGVKTTCCWLVLTSMRLLRPCVVLPSSGVSGVAIHHRRVPMWDTDSARVQRQIMQANARQFDNIQRTRRRSGLVDGIFISAMLARDAVAPSMLVPFALGR